MVLRNPRWKCGVSDWFCNCPDDCLLPKHRLKIIFRRADQVSLQSRIRQSSGRYNAPHHAWNLHIHKNWSEDRWRDLYRIDRLLFDSWKALWIIWHRSLTLASWWRLTRSSSSAGPASCSANWTPINLRESKPDFLAESQRQRPCWLP